MTDYQDHQFIRLGGRKYPRKSSRSCHTCISPYRAEVEENLLKGYGYAAIVRSLPDDQGDKKVTVESVRAHLRNGHMTLGEDVQRAMVEARASEVGRSLDEEPSLVDHVTLARLGVQQVFERIADGTLQPDVKDGIAFANLLMKAEVFEGSDVDQQAMIEAFGAYMEAAEAVMSDAQMHQFAQILSSHPVLRALHAREARKGLEAAHEVVDAEVVEESEMAE